MSRYCLVRQSLVQKALLLLWHPKRGWSSLINSLLLVACRHITDISTQQVFSTGHTASGLKSLLEPMSSWEACSWKGGEARSSIDPVNTIYKYMHITKAEKPYLGIKSHNHIGLKMFTSTSSQWHQIYWLVSDEKPQKRLKKKEKCAT